jgi:2'-5' RNA ligase
MNDGRTSGDFRNSRPGQVLRALKRTMCRPFSGCRRQGPTDQVQLAVVIPVSEEIANYATGTQIEILREYGSNPGLDAYPHITLKMGFAVGDIAPFERYVEELAKGETPFEISVRNFGCFEDGILFLDVEPGAALERLRQRVLGDLSEIHGIRPEAIEGPQFHFHITLAYGLSRREFERLRNTYAARHVEFNFRVSHIDLFRHTGHEWVSCKHAALKGVSQPA